jgi:hypothetical protein
MSLYTVGFDSSTLHIFQLDGSLIAVKEVCVDLCITPESQLPMSNLISVTAINDTVCFEQG